MKRFVFFAMVLVGPFCLLSAANGQTINSQATSSSSDQAGGGIVYSDGKDAIYWDPSCPAEGINLTKDLPGAKVLPPFAVSADGEWLAWYQGGKLWVRQLPKGTPYAIKFERTDGKHYDRDRWNPRVPRVEETFVWENPISRMALSPNGCRLSFETRCQRPAWILAHPGNPAAFAKMVEATGGAILDPRQNRYGSNFHDAIKSLSPTYVWRTDSYVGTFLLSTVYNEMQQDSPWLTIYKPVFGNIIAQSPPHPVWQASDQDYKAMLLYGGMNPNSEHFRGISVGVFRSMPSDGPHLYAKGGIKKHAGFLTFSGCKDWQKGKRLAYFVYKTEMGFTLEIRLIESDMNGFAVTQYYQGMLPDYEIAFAYKDYSKVTAWEIPLPIAHCEGIAVRPDDGGVTIKSDGTVYLISGDELENSMKRASTKAGPAKEGGFRVLLFADNILSVKSEVIAREIPGNCMHWAPDGLLFLDAQGTVRLWKKQGEAPEKFRENVGKWFCYCEIPPRRNSVASGRGSGYAPTGKAAGLKAGYIRTTYDGNLGKVICVGNVGHQKLLEYCQTNESDFAKVGDLSQYKWQRLSADDKMGVSKLNSIKLSEGKIVILREQGGNTASLIKPLDFGKRTKVMVNGVECSWDSAGVSYDWESREMSPEEKKVEAEVIAIGDPRAFSARKTAAKITPKASAALQEKKYESSLQTKTGKPFSVGQYPFFQWVPVDGGSEDKLFLGVKINESMYGQITHVKAASAEEGANIESVNPAQYFGKDAEEAAKRVPKRSFIALLMAKNEILLMKFEKLPGKYFAVQWLENIEGQIVYKKKFWAPGSESPRVALRGDK